MLFKLATFNLRKVKKICCNYFDLPLQISLIDWTNKGDLSLLAHHKVF